MGDSAVWGTDSDRVGNLCLISDREIYSSCILRCLFVIGREVIDGSAMLT